MRVHNPYNRFVDVITVLEEDLTGRKIGKHRANANDEEEVARIFNSIITKYSLNLEVVKLKKSEAIKWIEADEEYKW